MRDPLPIIINDDYSKPVGYVVLDESIDKNIIMTGALVPNLVRQGLRGYFEPVAFRLINKTTVDTRPVNLL